MSAPNAGILSDALLSQTLRRTAVYDAGAKMTLLFSFFVNKTKYNRNEHSQQICRHLPLGHGLTDSSHFGPFFIFKHWPLWHIYLLFLPFLVATE